SVIGTSFAFRDWYRGVSTLGQTYVSEVYLRAAAPKIDIVSVTTPIFGPDGKTLGYLVGQHTIAALATQLAAIRPAAFGRIALVDHHAHLAIERTDPKTDPPV